MREASYYDVCLFVNNFSIRHPDPILKCRYFLIFVVVLNNRGGKNGKTYGNNGCIIFDFVFLL